MELLERQKSMAEEEHELKIRLLKRQISTAEKAETEYELKIKVLRKQLSEE